MITITFEPASKLASTKELRMYQMTERNFIGMKRIWVYTSVLCRTVLYGQHTGLKVLFFIGSYI